MYSALEKKIKEDLDTQLSAIETKLGADVISIYSPIVSGLDSRVRQAVEAIPTKKDKVAIILDTNGGIVEVVERMVTVLRHHYKEVIFIVPDKAMSAGTVFAMSGDRILMNYFSVLGPIDPQVYKDGRFIPALSYLDMYDELLQRSANKTITTAEFGMLDKFDLGELHTFQQARDLSIDLLEKWLSTYKFKDWVKTHTRQLPVTAAMKSDRAREVAKALSDNKRWHSHSRGIGIEVIKNDLNIKIEDYDKDLGIQKLIHDYFEPFAEFLTQKNISSFVHSRYYF